MIKEYIVVADKAIGYGDNEVCVINNTSDIEKNNEKFTSINMLKKANDLYGQYSDARREEIEALTGAKVKIKEQLPWLGMASVAVSYLLAHLSVVPYDGDVTKLLAAWGTHLVVIAGLLTVGTISKEYQNVDKKSIPAFEATMDMLKNVIKKEEKTIDKINAEKAVDSKGSCDNITFIVDSEDKVKQLEKNAMIEYLFKRFDKQIKKAYLKGNLSEFFKKLDLDLTKDELDYAIKRVEDDLYAVNMQNSENVNKGFGLRKIRS